MPTNSNIPFHRRTQTFLINHPANRSTFLASHNTNRHNSESTMMTGTRYIISNSSNIYSNLSVTISHTRLFPTINILKISEIWKYSSNYFLTKPLIDRRLPIVLPYQDSFTPIAWKIRVKVPVFPKSEVVRCILTMFLNSDEWWQTNVKVILSPVSHYIIALCWNTEFITSLKKRVSVFPFPSCYQASG